MARLSYVAVYSRSDNSSYVACRWLIALHNASDYRTTCYRGYEFNADKIRSVIEICAPIW